MRERAIARSCVDCYSRQIDSVVFLWQLQIYVVCLCLCVYVDQFETEIRTNGKFGNEIASTRIVWLPVEKVSLCLSLFFVSVSHENAMFVHIFSNFVSNLLFIPLILFLCVAFISNVMFYIAKIK